MPLKYRIRYCMVKGSNMARVGPGETTIQFIMPAKAKDVLRKLAQEEGISSVSELIRQLLTNYCQANGADVDFTVGSWGGRRQKPSPIGSGLQNQDDKNRPVGVRISDGMIWVTLADGRIISNPLSWHPWLAKATPKQQKNVVLNAYSVDWPELDEGLDIEGMLRGVQPC
jgi:hypothetical protein